MAKVLVYTLTPHVYSDQFAFKILRLVLPEPLDIDPKLGDRTRFVLPFDNPKKQMQIAYEEIKAGLEELAGTTLLFLSSINTISWQIDQQPAGEVLRIKHSEHHIEVKKRVGGKTTSSSHFLCFSDAVKGLEKQRVAIAYELNFLQNITIFDSKELLAKQFKIIPAKPGRVAVFFPAEKETSGLRFHLHGPFMPELSRASIKETTVNEPLFKQLAVLAASSLHKIRDMGLLTGDFLGVLPNTKDKIPGRYQPIRDAIITEMNNEPLTPTQLKNHEPAKYLLQAKASLKKLLSEKDLEILLNYEVPFKWAIGAHQKSSDVDNFLNSLAIKDWGIESFVKMLEDNTSDALKRPDAEFMEWLTPKPVEWHQEFYALLEDDFITGAQHIQNILIDRLKSLKIIRLNNGSYSIGSNCYFPSDYKGHDELLPRVAIGVYSSGKIKVKQDAARRFLEKIGVREVGEAEQVEAILKQRYTSESFKPDIKDLNRFIRLVSKEPEQAKLFANYYIFECTDEEWGQPSQVFLDSPFMATGLSAYYEALGDDAHRTALAQSYKECGVSVDTIANFAKAVGVQTQLEITETNCNDNLQRCYLESVGGSQTRTAINRDYVITGLTEILTKPSRPISELIWKTMCALPLNPNYLLATYQNNRTQGAHRADSQLIYHLGSIEWVPQINGTFVIPSKAARGLLPEGFSFDSGQTWLKKVHFGENLIEDMNREDKDREEAAAEVLGINQKSLEDAKWFAGLAEDERQKFKTDHKNSLVVDFSDPKPVNPEGRSDKVRKDALDALDRINIPRPNSIPIHLAEVKRKTRQYLLAQYTFDGKMTCQVCKTPLPFKLDTGDDYFEMVEFLPELKKLHSQNYLALCPNHAAMFQYANGSSNLLKDKFLKMDKQVLEIVLAQKDTTIYFTKYHIADLKTVIKVDQQENEQEDQS